MADPAPRTITLTRPALVVVGLVVLLGLGVFIAQLVFIVQQREIVASQRAIAKRQEIRARPVLDTARALLGSPSDATAAAREAGAALDQLRGALRSAGHEDLAHLAGAALRRAPELIDAVDHATVVLDRTYPVLRDSLGVQRESLGVQRDTHSMLADSLSVQRAALDRLTAALDVARQTLAHAESIDRKTGGEAPAVLPGG